MPTYTYKDNDTGEVIDKFLKISELDDFEKNNPNLTKVIGAPALVSGHKSARQMAGNEWNDHIGRIKKGSGRDNSIKT
jgi:predicted nucleic acid-binding Zn ribbon protein